MSQYFSPHIRSGGDIKVELDLSNAWNTCRRQ